MIGLGWGVSIAEGTGGSWHWWNLVGLVVIGLALLRLTRFPLVVVIVLAALAGQIIGWSVSAFGVVPAVGATLLVIEVLARVDRRRHRPNTGRSAP
jgi:hypothetical protein